MKRALDIAVRNKETKKRPNLDGSPNNEPAVEKGWTVEGVDEFWMFLFFGIGNKKMINEVENTGLFKGAVTTKSDPI